jgi:uncharacterized protein (DUF2141 family)
MKSLVLIVVATCSALSLSAQADAATLTVEISGIEVATGILSAKVAANVDQHDNESKPVAGRRIHVSEKGTVTIHFSDLAPGKYAVSVMHDENGNGKLDSNILGIPKEGYGFSNNPRVMRKPTFDEASIELGASDQSIRIVLL